jgi:hypothetical protein
MWYLASSFGAQLGDVVLNQEMRCSARRFGVSQEMWCQPGDLVSARRCGAHQEMGCSAMRYGAQTVDVVLSQEM